MTTAWYGPGGHWRMLVGSKVDNKGLAVLYRSRDFKRWVKAKLPLHSAMTGMWECPDLFPVAGMEQRNGLDTSDSGVKHMLKNILDRYRYDYYTIGKYDKSTDRFVPDDPNGDQHRLRYDYGNFYASKTFYDPAKRRRVLLGWTNESDTSLDDRAKAWAGILAMPTKIWLSSSGEQLVQWPVDEVDTLRRRHVNFSDRVLEGGAGRFEVTGFKSVQSDVDVVFQLTDMGTAELFDPAWRRMDAQELCARRGADVKGGVGPFGLFTLASSNLGERTAVFFRVFKTQKNNSTHIILMCHDTTRSSYNQRTYRPTFAAFVDMNISMTKEIKLRTMIDHSVVESFGPQGRTCILSRVYPTRAVGDDARLFVFNNGESDVMVAKLNEWEMRSHRMNAPDHAPFRV